MEVHFTPEVEAKLEQIARESGCRSDELVVDAVRCHIDGLAYVREMLDRRYDDLESGRVKPIDGGGSVPALDGEDRSQAPRLGMSGYALHPEAYNDIDGIRAYS